MPHHGRPSQALGLHDDLAKQTQDLVSKLYAAFVAKDMSLLEINPLVVTKTGQLICLDAKVAFDANALYRHPDIVALRDLTEEDEKEIEASKHDLNYVALDGTIGCMVNGAGLAMATMDIIKLYGEAPANFLDVGGGATKEKVTAAFKIITADPKVKGILVNIFGGIMKCDVIAAGVVAAVKEVGLQVPLVVRLEGTNVALGKEIIAKSNLDVDLRRRSRRRRPEDRQGGKARADDAPRAVRRATKESRAALFQPGAAVDADQEGSDVHHDARRRSIGFLCLRRRCADDGIGRLRRKRQGTRAGGRAGGLRGDPAGALRSDLDRSGGDRPARRQQLHRCGEIRIHLETRSDFRAAVAQSSAGDGRGQRYSTAAIGYGKANRARSYHPRRRKVLRLPRLARRALDARGVAAPARVYWAGHRDQVDKASGEL